MFIGLNRSTWDPDPPDIGQAEEALLAIAVGDVADTWTVAWLRERVQFDDQGRAKDIHVGVAYLRGRGGVVARSRSRCRSASCCIPLARSSRLSSSSRVNRSKSFAPSSTNGP